MSEPQKIRPVIQRHPATAEQLARDFNVPVESIFVSNRYSYQAHIGLFIALLAVTRNVTPGSAASAIRILFFIVIDSFIKTMIS